MRFIVRYLRKQGDEMNESKGVLDGTGISLDSSELARVEESLTELKRRHKKNVCRYCLESIEFKDSEDKSTRIPFDLDGTAHWKTCLAGQFIHKKMALKMVQKFGVFFLLEQGVDLESKIGFTQKEAKVIHYIIERMLKSNKLDIKNEPVVLSPETTDETVKEELDKIDSIQQNKVSTEDLVTDGDDPIGDPDEDLAVAEDLISEE